MLSIKGLQKTSLIDYPDLISTVVFLSGCNLNCPYCHNPDLINKSLPTIKEEDVLNYLETKKQWIDAVVISGGEPSLHKELPDFLKKIKQLSLKVKIDTNGTKPLFLKELIEKNLVDYIAMDIKAPLNKYNKVTKAKVNTKDIEKSIEIIKNSNIDYEFRLTCVPSLIDKKDIENIGKLLKNSKMFYLQQFRNKITLDKKFEKEATYSKEELNIFKNILKADIKEVNVRA
ncbi:MAG: anaerobic ribonucleoside-triphosphate reductase activating protein [Candidatus Woesearchaeota archaeon]|jgi:pyruvate formate lyase activating enzyme|nr:anaerobic ribonucleoside-triphosphate reductase activating protein [Candidatus Woesearchaeota archaeon]MDP7506239.1 anaerobic ribonucleoside-triphosphate reductase activating protein [Candidatus Woesearchaeota archaeon]MDP7610711.1 anaerobic ribonucleoside-triphosphate reductase activating protein [Candidatus Woesearchaeota archaeon]|tara:strand:+ start:107 stop:796 length:690 start_codon:yes stop_codon:yes gene_type:complete